eukprot:CAMPEP_0194289216 /NCGR_PEP_ID=MMETSP0169-20130528/38602_1 /TAXON_ID=218684 /ORGANISM="Corethron pennatum, Strain L29A3" /LENGTH=653 /DNA_ID=CAMNT_0039036435 /DNA_START=205 /DNA_END=2166 /DNA_ORIENTATION=+
MVNVVKLLLWGLASSASSVKGQYNSQEGKREAEMLVQKAEQSIAAGNEQVAMGYFEDALKAYPFASQALMRTGFAMMTSKNKSDQRIGITRLANLWDERAHPMPIDPNSSQAAMMSSVIARYYVEEKEHKNARKFYKLSATSEAQTSHCASIALGTMLTAYPESKEDAEKVIHKYNKLMDKLLDVPELSMSNIPDPDAYTFCFASNFNHEIYHDADLRETMNKFYRLAIKALPHLDYTAPFLYNKKPKLGKKIKLGIASAFFGASSVVTDFGGTLSRLPNDVFEFYYIHVLDGHNPVEETPILAAAKIAGHKVIIIRSKGLPQNQNWLDLARQQIEPFELDLLLYLDLTMSGKIHQLAMSRLARVQATTHGHPVTSGIDRSVMNYYISWGAAELPQDEAQKHYTEQLVMFPTNHIHQYFFKRITDDRRSTQDDQKFDHITRSDFYDDLKIPLKANWYLCMQKPFKRMPQFDEMIAAIQRKDPKAYIILHAIEPMVQETQEIVDQRFRDAGCDLSRIRQIPAQPHHRLMGLYKVSDVVLDSYQAGGCTTTREALEVGSVVVTLPTKYLGGRWSKAFFDIIGINDTIAKDAEDYVRLSVHYASNKPAQKYMKNLVLKKIEKLYFNDEVVNMWTFMLVKMATGELAQDTENLSEQI